MSTIDTKTGMAKDTAAAIAHAKAKGRDAAAAHFTTLAAINAKSRDMYKSQRTGDAPSETYRGYTLRSRPNSDEVNVWKNGEYFQTFNGNKSLELARAWVDRR